MTERTVFLSNSQEETEDIGKKIGCLLIRGSVLALKGGLGAGKTCLTRGIARSLGVTCPVTSPTYTIIHEYEGAVPFFHIDAWRLSGSGDFEELGGIEILEGDSICVIEWSDHISGALPENTIFAEIKILQDGKREIVIDGLSNEIKPK
ncbi:tRNA (adenosine(37)-N6)-threonylcarbamoyltransferase complex ATPase subunit type 1 TsaE [Spirochaetia bacterium]|nr:tRNA (adenosine(37)-N6)-threonylcarbamoyltransferase complex ATPase subunit type 1 TsaE [Spirochaetia bacterium]